MCLVHHCHLGVGQSASHLCSLSCKQLTHHDEWKVCREPGSGGGMVWVRVRDREVKRELCLGLSVFQGSLIEGCFNAVAGWQVGIIIAICLRSRHPNWLLMAAACVVFPSALVDLTFIMGWNIHSSLLLFSFGLHEDVGFCITDEGTLRFAGLRVFLSHCKDAQQMLYAFPNSYLLYILET